MKYFEIAGVKYTAYDCSNGRTPQGEITARGAMRRIRETGLSGLKVLDICCGIGIVGLTMFKELGPEIITDLTFADINVFNIMSLRQTMAENGIDGFESHISDGLARVPEQEFDLIVSNPPHLPLPSSVGLHHNSPDTLGTFDIGWAFHRAFYADCHRYLSKRGETWFLENKKGGIALLADMRAVFGDRLELREEYVEESHRQFFWRIVGLKGKHG